MAYVVHIRFNKRLRVKKFKASKSKETFSSICFLVKTPSVVFDVSLLPQTRCLNHSVYASSSADAHVTVFRNLL